MEDITQYKTDVFTDHSDITAVIRAVIYNNDSARIVYLNENDQINTHDIYDVIYGDTNNWAPYNMKYFDLGISRINAKTTSSNNKHFTFYVCQILSIIVYDNDYKQSKIRFVHNVEKQRNPNLTIEEVESKLFKPHYTNLCNNIYSKYKYNPDPQIVSKSDFFNLLKCTLDEYLALEALAYGHYRTLYEFLLKSLNELKKYKLSDKEKFEYDILLIEKIHAYYMKFSNFDRTHHRFKYHLNSDLYTW